MEVMYGLFLCLAGIAILSWRLHNATTKNKRLEETLQISDRQRLEQEWEKKHLEKQVQLLQEKIHFQETEMDKMGTRFQQEFELLSNRILEEKSKKFTSQNQENITRILQPLTKDLEAFRKQVQDTYTQEAKERFSLETRVRELAQLNQKISQEAQNLTNALKGNSKLRGNWGEAILETILQNSGLEKNRHYSVQEYLRDEAGNPLLGIDGRKMQPDVIIHYPDNKKVIIDSKVSLLAYEQYCSEENEANQQTNLNQHVRAIKTHIDQLAAKQYESYARALDFVIMFVPLEAAYMIAIQADERLWEYAYKKRVLLISSSNLIAALKLIKDLWIRDDQTKNALEIAERGGRMYDKFATFLKSLDEIGRHLDRSQESFQTALKQLKTGKGNLISQAEKLKGLGINARNQLPEGRQD